MPQVVVEATATKTAAYTPSSGFFDISGYVGDWAVGIEIFNLTAASGTPAVDVAFESTTSADFSSAVVPGPVRTFVGPFTKENPLKVFLGNKREHSSMHFGVANGKLRCKLTALVARDGASPTITYRPIAEVQ